MKDMSINQKRWAEGIFEEEFGQALFFVSPTPHYVARETKVEPDRRLEKTQTDLCKTDILQLFSCDGSDFSQLRLEKTQTDLRKTDILQLFSSDWNIRCLSSMFENHASLRVANFD